MEDIYPPESFSASNRFPLRTYFEEFNQICAAEPLSSGSQINNEMNEPQYLLAIKELMETDISYNEIAHLSKSCSISNLTCEGENTKDFPMDVPPTMYSTSKLPSPFIATEDVLQVNKSLADLETQKNSTQLCWGNKRNYHKQLDFTVPLTPPDLAPGSDFVMSVLIYRPIAFKFFSAKNASEKLRFNHEILVLGRTTLAELRDTIICTADFGLCKEVENTSADLRPLADANSIYPSGFLFINDVFYNDFRGPTSIDYSKPIIDWGKQKKIRDLTSSNMEGVTINSLNPRFGYPYLYMHQGNCEHLFVFADAKLLDSGDCLHSQCYPHLSKLNRNSNRMCFMCTVSFAKWICVGSDRLPQHRMFLCTDCCNAYNYVDGKKLGDFKLYPYYEKHVVL